MQYGNTPKKTAAAPAKYAKTTTVGASKARVALLARRLDIGCPEILHERRSFTVPAEVEPRSVQEWYV